MNLGQLRQALYDRLRVLPGAEVYKAPILNRFLNQALAMVSTEYDWPWLEKTETLTTTANQNYATPAADWSRTRSVTSTTDGGDLQLVAISDFDTFIGSSGVPSMFAIWAGKLYLNPTPDGAYTYTHRYICYEPALTNDTDTPLIPTAYQPALIEFAAAMAFRRGGDTEQAEAALALDAYRQWLNAFKDNRRRYSVPARVRTRRDPFF